MLLMGDNLKILPTIESGSIQCVVTSPPYDNLRTYGGHSWQFEPLANELLRVLCDGGIACWNVGDSVVDGSETLTAFKQALYFKSIGFRVHDTMIYEKVNFSNPEKVRYHQMFEYVFIISKDNPRCFNPIKDKKNIYAGSGPLGKNTSRQSNGNMTERTKNTISEFGMRGNVWKGNTAGQEDMCGSEFKHPAMMPFWLARDLIQSWSNPGDTILDPFFGSGTTGKASELLGRQWIGIEINPEYEQIALGKTAQSGLILI